MSQNKLNEMIKSNMVVKQETLRHQRSTKELLNDFIGLKPNKEYEEIKKKPRQLMTEYELKLE